MLTATYVFIAALERDYAYHAAYCTVCECPREIGGPEGTEMLVIDFDDVYSDDQEMAIRKANARPARHPGRRLRLLAPESGKTLFRSAGNIRVADRLELGTAPRASYGEGSPREVISGLNRRALSRRHWKTD